MLAKRCDGFQFIFFSKTKSVAVHVKQMPLSPYLSNIYIFSCDPGKSHVTVVVPPEGFQAIYFEQLLHTMVYQRKEEHGPHVPAVVVFYRTYKYSI